jgi:hypothetical protein
MKIKSLFVAVLLMGGVLVAPNANATEDPKVFQKPQLESFTFSPKEIELTNGDQNITLEVTVSHPVGIISKNMNVNFSKVVGATSITFSVTLPRTDSPINTKFTKVIYKGQVNIPASTSPGVWNISSSPVLGYSPTGGDGWYSDVFTPENFRTMPDAENALLVRINGDLLFDFQTFVGPSFSTDKYASDSKPVSLFGPSPIFRKGETVDFINYLELRTKNVEIQITSLTPAICTGLGSKLVLVGIGNCQYKIFTLKTKDYLYKELVTSNEIKSPRFKPEIFAPIILDQVVTSYPQTIARDLVFSWDELVSPVSESPSVCVAVGKEIQLFSSGQCKFTYSMAATEARFASDVYTQSFAVKKVGETAAVPTPVVTPTPTPTPTAKPVVKKTITCVKGKKTVKKTAVSPKCPKGYKLKK